MWHSLPSCDRGSAGKVVRSAELCYDSLSFLLHLMGLLVPGNTLVRKAGVLTQKAKWTNYCRTDVASVSFVPDLGSITLGL